MANNINQKIDDGYGATYGGPQPDGQAQPAGYADPVTGNPYSQSSPNVDGVGETSSGFSRGQPDGYYTNPQGANMSGNPFSGGYVKPSEAGLSAAYGQALSAIYDDVLTSRNQGGGTDTQPTMSDYNYDLGFGRTNDESGRS
jgi:hypothetical protein